jgi:tRNA threonylcarbamoyladenosine biosynthesis protein TsaE
MQLNKNNLTEYGITLGRLLQPGDVVALIGELGSGKTTLAQSIAEGLGVMEPVTSPTFTIINEYESGRLPLYHFDVYRLKSPEEMESLGYEEYFFGSGVTIVEWADRVGALLPPHTRVIRLAYGDNPDERIINDAVADQAGYATVSGQTQHAAPVSGQAQHAATVSGQAQHAAPATNRSGFEIHAIAPPNQSKHHNHSGAKSPVAGLNILALETSGQRLSVALAMPGNTNTLKTHNSLITMELFRAYSYKEAYSREELNHLTELFPVMQSLLADAGLRLSDLGAIAVSAGPGSFTGIRIGISAARALAQATGLPLVKVPTLESFVFHGAYEAGAIVCPVFDARREQIYAGAFRHETADSGPVQGLETLIPGAAYPPELFLEKLRPLLIASGTAPRIMFPGDGAALLREAAENCTLECAKFIPPEAWSRYNSESGGSEPRSAASVARWAVCYGIKSDYRRVEPIYMRKAEAQRRLDEQALKNAEQG